MIELNRQALNKQLSKYPGLEIEIGCTFCTIRNAQPTPHETQQHFYSECIYIQRLWTDIKDWAAGNQDASYKKDRIFGIPMQDPYSIDNSILRETRSPIQRDRYKKTIPTIENLKNRLKRQIHILLNVIKNQPLKEGLEKIYIMADNQETPQTTSTHQQSTQKHKTKKPKTHLHTHSKQQHTSIKQLKVNNYTTQRKNKT